MVGRSAVVRARTICVPLTEMVPRVPALALLATPPTVIVAVAEPPVLLAARILALSTASLVTRVRVMVLPDTLAL